MGVVEGELDRWRELGQVESEWDRWRVSGSGGE